MGFGATIEATGFAVRRGPGVERSYRFIFLHVQFCGPIRSEQQPLKTTVESGFAGVPAASEQIPPTFRQAFEMMISGS
jgi:hypothetical protein